MSTKVIKRFRKRKCAVVLFGVMNLNCQIRISNSTNQEYEKFRAFN